MAHNDIDDQLYTHFITFSCYHRRQLLDHDQPKRILLGVLNEEIEKFSARRAMWTTATVAHRFAVEWPTLVKHLGLCGQAKRLSTGTRRPKATANPTGRGGTWNIARWASRFSGWIDKNLW